MIFYHYISLKELADGQKLSEKGMFTFSAVSLMHSTPENEEPYGIKLFREAIGLYEKQRGIDPTESKRAFPFFRQNSRWLVGPEMSYYYLTFFEHQLVKPPEDKQIILAVDYERLVAYCLEENMTLVRCKYDHDQMVTSFVTALEKEYDKFVIENDQVGFSATSQLFTLLSDSWLKCHESSSASDDEWRMAQMLASDEVDYVASDDSLVTTASISIPLDCIAAIALADHERHPLLYGTVMGLLRKLALQPERLLYGMD